MVSQAHGFSRSQGYDPNVRLADLRDLDEPTIRDRPVGLLLIALVSAILAVLVALSSIELFLGAAAYADWTTPKLVGNDFVGMVQVYPEHYLLMGALLLVPGLFLLALSVGILRGRPWALILGIVAGGLIGLYGLLALVIPGDASAGADRWHPGASLPYIALGGALIWYFGRRPVKNDLGWGDPAFG